MPQSRSAHHTINGYKYQFDKAIITLAAAKDDELVAMECIEDIDIGKSDLIQCKYLAEQTYYPSSIREPLQYFLKHFASVTGNPPTYTLYAHFGQNSPTSALSYEDVIKVLGKSSVPVTDAQLRLFVSDHFRFIPGPQIETQEKDAFTAIRLKLNCSTEECEWCFYSNAFAEVLRLSRQATERESSTTPREFFKRINKKQLMLDHWLAQLQSTDDYLKFSIKKLHARRSLSPSKRRYVVLGSRFLDKCTHNEIATVIESAIHSSYRLKTALYTATPITFIFDCDDSKLKDIKIRLIEKQIPFNDGYEHLSFNVSMFEKPPIINRVQTTGSKASDLLADSSYHVRVISKSMFQLIRADVREPQTLIDISSSSHETIPHFENADNFLFASIQDVDMLINLLCSKEPK